MRLRIVGIGSFHGDDRVGWQAVSSLREVGLGPGCSDWEVDYLSAAIPGPALIAAFAGTDVLVVVDALMSADAPGTIRVLSMDEISSELAPLSSHGMDVPHSLALARQLHGDGARVAVIGIAAGGGYALAELQAVIRNSVSG